jgi:hypothetical protein
MSARIGGAEFLNQMKTSTAFRQFQLNQGRAFGSSAAAQPYLDQARHDIHAGVTDRLTGDTQANEAMARHRAAVLMATDEHASPEDRLAANEYLLGTTHAMLAARFSSASIRPPNTTSIGAPANRTGVDAGALVRKADSAAKASMSGRGGTQRAGVATESLARSGQEFATAVAGDVTSVANSVHGARQGAEELGTTAGLTGAQEADTRGRTRASVASNLQETLPEFLRPQKASNRPAQGQSESGDMEPASTARAGGGDGNTSPVLQTNSNEDLRKADIRLPAGARFFVQPEELDAAAAVSDSTATADSGAPTETGGDEAKGLTSAQTDHASNADHAHGSGAGDEVQTSRSEGHGIAAGGFAGSAQEDLKQPRTMEDSESAFAGDEASSEAAGASAARDGVDYAMAGSEPQMAHTAQSGGHYYLPLLIGKMVDLSPERVRTIAAYSQFPDQVSALDGYTNGVRRTFSHRAYEAAQVGEFSERAIHALNGRTTIENLAFYQREIAKYRNDDARVGIAMHGLVDSIFHSRPVNGVNVTYGAPLGHGLHGSDPDYISEEQAKAAAGQLMRAFETVSGVKLNDGQRAQVMTTVNQALTRARTLTDGEVKAFHEGELRYGHGSGGRPPKQNERMEINFRRAVTEMMGPRMPILSPPENLPSPFWRGQITPAGSVEETKQFIGGSQAVAGGFAERGMEAAGDIMRDFAKTSPGFLKYQNLYVNKLYDTQAWSLKDVIPGYLAAPHTRPF